MANCLPDGSGLAAILWGDSHAIHLYAGLRASIKKEGYALGVLTASACSPIKGYTIAARPKCPSFNDQALATILSLKPKLVILSAAWIITSNSMQLLDDIAPILTEKGIKVVILGQSPLYKTAVPTTLAARLEANNLIRTVEGDELWLGRMDDTDSTMKKRFGARNDLTYIPLTPLICPKGECPLATTDGVPLLFDTEHLTDKAERVNDFETVQLCI